MHWGAWATQAAPRSSRQSDLVAVLPLVTHTPTPPHVAFVRAPTDDSSHQTEPAFRTHEKGVRPLFRWVNSKHVTYAASSVSRLLHRRTARDGRHSDWAGGSRCGDLRRRPSGPRSRARPSRAVLRYCSCRAPVRSSIDSVRLGLYVGFDEDRNRFNQCGWS